MSVFGVLIAISGQVHEGCHWPPACAINRLCLSSRIPGGSEISDLEGFAAEVAAYLARGKVPALRTIFHLQRCRYCSSAWPGSGREVVGLYVGAMEFGPRALGHRSLLASATDPAINSDLTLGGKYVKLPVIRLGKRRSLPQGMHAWGGRTTCHLPQ